MRTSTQNETSSARIPQEMMSDMATSLGEVQVEYVALLNGFDWPKIERVAPDVSKSDVAHLLTSFRTSIFASRAPILTPNGTQVYRAEAQTGASGSRSVLGPFWSSGEAWSSRCGPSST